MHCSRVAAVSRRPRLVASAVSGLISRWQARQRMLRNSVRGRSTIDFLRRLLEGAAHFSIAVFAASIIGGFRFQPAAPVWSEPPSVSQSRDGFGDLAPQLL